MLNTFLQQFQLPARQSERLQTQSFKLDAKPRSRAEASDANESQTGRFVTAPTAFTTAMKLAKQSSKQREFRHPQAEQDTSPSTQPEMAMAQGTQSERTERSAESETPLAQELIQECIENNFEGTHDKQVEVTGAAMLQSALPSWGEWNSLNSVANSTLKTPSVFASRAFASPSAPVGEASITVTNLTSVDSQPLPANSPLTRRQLASFLTDLQAVLPSDVFTSVQTQLQSVTWLELEEEAASSVLTEALSMALRPASTGIGRGADKITSNALTPKSLFELRLASELQRTYALPERSPLPAVQERSPEIAVNITGPTFASGHVTNVLGLALPVKKIGPENSLESHPQADVRVAENTVADVALSAPASVENQLESAEIAGEVSPSESLPSFPDFWADMSPLGQSASHRSATPLAATRGNGAETTIIHPLASQAVDAVRDLMATRRQELILNLNPEHLGSMRVSIAHHRIAGENRITATLMVDNLEAKSQLDATLTDLHERMQRHGLSLAKVEVIQSASATSETQNQSRGGSSPEQREQTPQDGMSFSHFGAGARSFSQPSASQFADRIQNTAVLTPDDENASTPRTPAEDDSHRGVTLPDGRVNLSI